MRSLNIFLLSTIMALAYSGIASGQNKEIADLVSRLSWSSIGMNCEVFGDICSEGDEAKQLVQIGRPATKALLTVLKDKEKAVAAHVILTAIWEPSKPKGSMRFGMAGYTYTYNGVEWSTVFEGNKIVRRVEKEVLLRNADMWQRRIFGMQ